MDIETIIKIENDMRYKPDTFTGTEDEWAAVPTAQRAHYKIVNITDDLEAGKTTLNISTELTRLYGATVTITDGEETIQKTLSNSGTTTAEVHNVGTYTISCDIYTDSVNVARMGITIAHVIEPHIVSWSTGTDAQITQLVAAADAGDIDLYDDAGWRVGDERTISLAAMEATGVGESHAAQDTTWVLMHRGLYKKSSDDSTVNFVVGMKGCLNEMGYINSTDTYTGSWDSCARRTWCNSVFKNSVPSLMTSIFKQVKVTTAASSSSNQVTNDFFFLAAEKEVLGASADRSNIIERNVLTQFDYYTSSEVRAKSSNGWWFRSPDGEIPSMIDCANFRGESGRAGASRSDIGISVHACI